MVDEGFARLLAVNGKSIVVLDNAPLSLIVGPVIAEDRLLSRSKTLSLAEEHSPSGEDPHAGYGDSLLSCSREGEPRVKSATSVSSVIPRLPGARIMGT